MSSAYKIIEPTQISFSGGRSSAYMLNRVLDANGGIPDGSRVVFANTGKEMPETLDFVQACSDSWGVDITWVELGAVTLGEPYGKGVHKGKPRRTYETVVVDYQSASRNGEPFNLLVRARKMLPNVVARFCTADLKVRRINDITPDCTSAFIGIRADEQRRVVKIHNKMSGRRLTWCPLYLDGVTKEDVGAFWRDQSFDLQLPNDNGVTPLGNCDLCFLKGKAKRLAIMRSRPELAQWWIDAEEEIGEQFSSRASYKELISLVDYDQADMIDEVDCFCGD